MEDVNKKEQLDNLGAALDKILPKRLDDIVRANRDRLAVRLSTQRDLDVLPPMSMAMNSQRHVKATIEDWRIICVESRFPNGESDCDRDFLFLVGDKQPRGTPLVTSNIKSVDFEQGLVLTLNSLYRIGKAGEGEPNPSMILTIIGVLRGWGLGPAMGLLPVFF